MTFFHHKQCQSIVRDKSPRCCLHIHNSSSRKWYEIKTFKKLQIPAAITSVDFSLQDNFEMCVFSGFLDINWTRCVFLLNFTSIKIVINFEILQLVHFLLNIIVNPIFLFIWVHFFKKVLNDWKRSQFIISVRHFIGSLGSNMKTITITEWFNKLGFLCTVKILGTSHIGLQ